MAAGGEVGGEDLGVDVQRLDAGPGGAGVGETFGGEGARVGDVGDGGVDGEVGGVINEVVDRLGAAGCGGALRVGGFPETFEDFERGCGDYQGAL